MGEMAPESVSRKVIEVAAGVLKDSHGRVLLMQRLPGKHLAGLWEFPGGKLEPGEAVEQALARELDEELGIEVRVAKPLISLPWHYPEKSVRLHAWWIAEWRGEPRAREGNPLRWIALRDIDPAAMPPADAPIITALRLPPYYAISPCPPLPRAASSLRGEGEQCVRESRSAFPPLPHAVHGGEGRGEGAGATSALWQLRVPEATDDEIRHIAQRALAINSRLRGALLINHDITLARELRIGVHLKATQLRELRERPLAQNVWVGASCHDAEELELAAGLGVDFATLSPVRTTSSHPGVAPLGWARFSRLVADARLPVYALGGVGPDDLERARSAGAQGVAGIRAFLGTS